MEPKKSPKVDINKQTWLFLLIGLTISLSLSLMSFEYGFVESIQSASLSDIKMDFDEMQDVIPTVQLPPPVPVIQQPEVKTVPDEAKINKDIQVNLQNELTLQPQKSIFPSPIKTESKKAEPIKEEIVECLNYAEIMPEPEGGIAAFYKFVKKEIKYPAVALRLGIEGKVFVQFVVDKEGNLSDITVTKGIHESCDQEAIRVLKKSPRWKPGKQGNNLVKVKMVIPIQFKIN